MIDTCVGNDKPRAYPQLDNLQTPYFDDLRAAGFEPDQFDTVLCTHMHVDHVGWNTRWVDGRWVPTFPNARYLFSRAEWEHCEATPDISPGDFMRDSVAPLVEAGLHMIVEGDHHITSEVWLVPTPGHTPGHVSVRISSAGQDALITGDMIHHPIQCSEPSLSSHFDHDADGARDTREKLLASCCDQDILILGTHFADPTGGRLIAGAGGRRLVVDEP